MPSKNVKSIKKKMPESKEYAVKEAVRYLKNAKETLSKSPIENNKYQDVKYVQEASGIAYLSALLAIDGWLVDKNLWSKQNTNSIESYKKVLHQHPFYKQLSDNFEIVYDNLHLAAYYNGATSTGVVKDGLLAVKNIIELIKKN